jgi:ATP-dependent DNA helicase RecQ
MSDVERLRTALKRHFGFSRFRPHQQEIVEAILSGRDVFAALPTGGGKSLCYQLPALLTEGLTVVVSPLISLMKDQVDAARENGIAAAFINSSLKPPEIEDVRSELFTGKTRLLYVAPERLSTDRFRADLSRLPVSLIAVDEAHCISEWGHDFRPDYRALGNLRQEFPGVPIAAFTATATTEVQADVIRQLHLRSPLAIRASFDRKEISYAVIPKRSARRLAKELVEVAGRHPNEPGIIYRSSRKSVEETAALLTDAGYRAVAYHAGLEDADRRSRQEAFVRDEVDIVVATIAFGMGIDKSNVRWIVHGDLPRSIESYYQETGRAARDGEPAETVLFYGPQDISIIRYHIGNIEDDAERERAQGRLRTVLRYAESSVCRRKQLLAHFNEDHPGNCGNCDVCLGSVDTEDLSVAAQKILSAALRTGERFGGHHLADIVTGNPTDKVLQFGHNELPTYGVGSDMDKGWWLDLIRNLEASGCLARTDGQKSGFRITAEGRQVLFGKQAFSAVSSRRRSSALPERGSGARAATGSGAGTLPATGSGAAGNNLPRPGEDALFEKLRELRRRLARERSVPPYVVFSDKSLRSMARNRPTDLQGLLRCHGVGERKLEEYGEDFVSAIREFLGY